MQQADTSDEELIAAFVELSDGMTQSALATAAGVSQKRISDWRNGDRGRLQKRTREALARFVRRRERGLQNGSGVTMEVLKDADPEQQSGALSLEDRVVFEQVIHEFRLTEGVRRQAGHVSIHGWVAGAKDYAEELGASDAVLDALEEWGRELRRREKERS